MTPTDIKRYLNELELGFNQITVGKLTAKDKAILIRRGESLPTQTAVNGRTSSYEKIGLDIILRWTKNAEDSDKKIKELIEIFKGLPGEDIGSFKVVLSNYRRLVDLGVNENEVYEYALGYEIVYKSKEED